MCYTKQKNDLSLRFDWQIQERSSRVVLQGKKPSRDSDLKAQKQAHRGGLENNKKANKKKKKILAEFFLNKVELFRRVSEEHSQPSQKFKMKLFAKIVNDFQLKAVPLIIFVQSSIFDG